MSNDLFELSLVVLMTLLSFSLLLCFGGSCEGRTCPTEPWPLT